MKLINPNSYIPPKMFTDIVNMLNDNQLSSGGARKLIRTLGLFYKYGVEKLLDLPQIDVAFVESLLEKCEDGLITLQQVTKTIVDKKYYHAIS